jgi:hypothetical protein
LVGAGLPTIPISGVNVRNHGAKGDWNPYTLVGTDDTEAIRAAVAACPMGGTVFFPGTGPNRRYLISGQIDITTPNIRILGAPRDAYATSVRCNTVNTMMFLVKTTGVVFQDIGIEGGGGAITGVEVWGDPDGNCDSRFEGVTLMRLLTGVRTRGRNNTFMGECIFSISTEGIVCDGPDSKYHTGGNAFTSMRGNKVINCRFHGNGSSRAHGNIRVTPAARVLSMQIMDNEFDGNAVGTHIIAAGDTGYRVKNLICHNNAHNMLKSEAYDFSYVDNAHIDGATMSTSNAAVSRNGYLLDRCNFVTITNGLANKLGMSGLKATNCTVLRVRDSTFNTVGLNTAFGYHGMDIDSSNSDVQIENVTVANAPGFGFVGSPLNSSMSGCVFIACKAGAFSSTTMTHRSSKGRNTFVEGSDGRKQDYATKSYDLTVAAGATRIATIRSTHAYSSFEVEVKVIGRNAAGNLYASSVRYVRPENGNPQYVTPVPDVVQGTISLAFTTSGVTGVAVSATVTGSDAFVTCHVTALAGGGFGANARGTTVTMS